MLSERRKGHLSEFYLIYQANSMENYGGGKKSDIEQTALGMINTGFKKEDLDIPLKDREILMDLASSVKEISERDEQKEKIILWKDHNMLKRTRPVIFCDPENGWNEIITEKQMKCHSRIGRVWEMNLRKEIFWGNEMGDDRPVVDYFNVPITTEPDDWGIEAKYKHGQTKEGSHQGGSYVWDPPIKDYDKDLEKIHLKDPEIDWEVTNGTLDMAMEIFGNILKVRLKSTWWWTLGLTLTAVTLRGLENMLFDFYQHPEGLKELLSIISEGFLKKLDYLESNNLLSLNNDNTYIASGGIGHTEELPQDDFNEEHIRTMDMWGFADSQETTNVSPEMYEEFLFPNEKPIFDRFGINCYGCCEPVHSRWHIIKRHTRLRRVSCSPWVDVDRMVSYLGDKYIFSRKPNPVVIAVNNIDKDAIRNDIREFFKKTKDCNVEIIMKDNHTLGNRPENIVEWSRIAKEEASRIYN